MCCLLPLVHSRLEGYWRRGEGDQACATIAPQLHTPFVPEKAVAALSAWAGFFFLPPQGYLRERFPSPRQTFCCELIAVEYSVRFAWNLDVLPNLPSRFSLLGSTIHEGLGQPWHISSLAG